MLKKYKKKNIVIYVAVIVIILLFLGYIWFTKQKKSSEELSPRAKDFIKENYPNFREKGIEDNSGTLFTTECFSLKIPYISTNQKFEKDGDKCTFRARLIEPPAQLVIFNEKLKWELDEHPSISMRRIEKNKYTETTFYIKNYDEILRFDAKESVVFFLKADKNLITIAFSNIAKTENITKEDIIKITEEFKLL